ncbi:MAG: stage III sporulation protein AB [Clostridia bacterium]|nr:stage III sporulation protein AB [Clostridia bacterium]
MVGLKIFGVLLIVGVGGVSSYIAVQYEKRRLAILDAWIDLIFYIRGQIDCYLTPLNEILANGDPALIQACMPRANTIELPVIFEASSTYLDGDVKRLLENFMREIGSSYREEQVRRCDFYLDSLRTQREKVAAELPSRIRLYVALCICTSMGASILLW